MPASPSHAQDTSVPDPAPANPVESARLIDRAGHSEMRVGIRTDAFGSIQVHTVVHNSEVGLSLGSERGDLRTFLANELPALENNLRQHELHFESVRFASDTAAMSGNPHGGPGPHSQQQQPRWFASARALLHTDGGEEPPAEDTISNRAGLSLHV